MSYVMVQLVVPWRYHERVQQLLLAENWIHDDDLVPPDAEEEASYVAEIEEEVKYGNLGIEETLRAERIPFDKRIGSDEDGAWLEFYRPAPDDGDRTLCGGEESIQTVQRLLLEIKAAMLTNTLRAWIDETTREFTVTPIEQC